MESSNRQESREMVQQSINQVIGGLVNSREKIAEDVIDELYDDDFDEWDLNEQDLREAAYMEIDRSIKDHVTTYS